MTRMLFACFLLMATASSLAQTFACQYVASGGLSWESGTWVASGFKKKEPFFFTIKAGVGITSFKGDKFLEDDLVCDNSATRTAYEKVTRNGRHSCSTYTGDYLYFQEKTLRGTISSRYGGVLDGDKRDTLTISPFICTKM